MNEDASVAAVIVSPEDPEADIIVDVWPEAITDVVAALRKLADDIEQCAPARRLN